MASTYVNDLRLEEMATGDQSGTWGDTTNTNLELIAEAFSYGTQASFGSDADATTTIADGASDPARSLYLKITSGVSLTATRTLTIAPNTVSKIWIIENATSGSQSINISQGSGANVTIPSGDVKVIYTDGAGSGAAVVDAFTDLNTSGTLTATNLAGTLATAAQPNITSVGTLTGFTSTGIDDNATSTAITIDSSENSTFSNSIIFSDSSYSAAYSIRRNSDALILSGGTSGYYFNRSDNSATDLYINGSGSVGIGITSLNEGKLHVKSDGAGEVELLTLENSTGTNGKTTLTFKTTSTDATKSAQIFAERVNASGHTDLAFRTYNGSTTEAVRIDHDGNVGIGTTATDGMLTIKKTGSNIFGDSAITIQSADTNQSTLALGLTGSVAYVDSTESGSGTVLPLVFATGSTEKMRIDSSGNLAVANGNQTAANVSSRIMFGNKGTFTDSGVGRAEICGVSEGALWYSGTALAFYTNPGPDVTGTTPVERMRIDSSGNVLVGTTSAILSASGRGNITINGSSDSILNLGVGGSQAGYLYHNGTALNLINTINGELKFFTNDLEKMRIDSSGRVGIAQDAPGDFNAAADDLVIGNSGGDFGMTIRTGTSSNGSIHFADGTTGDGPNRGIITYDHSDDHMQFNVAAAEVMRINSSGNVGIGETSITARLHIKANGDTTTPCTINNTAAGADARNQIQFRRSGTIVGSITSTASATAFNTSSDARLKDVTGEARGLEVINELNPVAYNWKESGQADEGLIAQEVLDIVPNAVSGSEEDMYQMDYSKLVVHLVKGMKEQQTQIDALQSEINLLKGE